MVEFCGETVKYHAKTVKFQTDLTHFKLKPGTSIQASALEFAEASCNYYEEFA